MKNDFEHNLIKGRIAEMVFEMMMRESNAFTVIPFGYENMLPELLHYQNINQQRDAVRRVKKAPDFVIINQKEKEVRLVEVKYNRDPYLNTINTIAEELKNLWDPSWLFLATPTEFYFDSASQIVEKGGTMNLLDMPEVSFELKQKYLRILNDFEQDSPEKSKSI